MSFYNIHNLICVKLSKKIDKDILDEINFQIGYFKTSESSLSLKYKINIYPYTDSFDYRKKCNDIFHLTTGNNTEFHNPNKLLYLKKTDLGFDIYCSGKGLILNFYIQLLLLKENIALVHAAAVADNENNVYLFPGPGGVGKTAIVNHFIKNKDCKLLGDDLIGVRSDGVCYSFPRHFVLKPYHINTYTSIFKEKNLSKSHFNQSGMIEIVKNRKRDKFLLFERFILRNLPFGGILYSILYRIGFVNFMTEPKPETRYFSVPIEQIFGHDCILDQGRIKSILYLERNHRQTFISSKICNKELSNKLFSVINHEWVDAARDTFSMGALEFFELKEYYDKTYNIYSRFLENSTKKNKLEIPVNALPPDLQMECEKLISHE